MMTPDRKARTTAAIKPPERLDARLAPSAITVPVHAPSPSVAMHGNPPPKAQGYTPNGSAMDKAGQILNIIHTEFQKYESTGAVGTFTSSQAGKASITGTSVKVDIRAKGDITALTAQLKVLGMTVTASAPQFGIIEGTLPIAQLPTVASYSAVIGIDPIQVASTGRAR